MRKQKQKVKAAAAAEEEEEAKKKHRSILSSFLYPIPLIFHTTTKIFSCVIKITHTHTQKKMHHNTHKSFINKQTTLRHRHHRHTDRQIQIDIFCKDILA